MSDKTNSPRRRISRLGFPVFALLLASLLIAHWAFLEDMDALAFDFALRLRGEQAPDPRIVIVGIDDGSLASVGPWPWKPEVLSRLFARILGAQPSVLALDLVLGRPLEEYPALLNSRSVVLASALGTRMTKDGSQVFWQEPSLSQSPGSLALGHIHAGKDADGVCRSVPLLLSFEGRRRWAFSFEIARLFLGVPESEVRIARSKIFLGDSLGVPRLAEPIDHAVDALGVLPVMGLDHLLINSRGGTGTFPSIPASTVLAGESKALEQLSNRIVLVGATSYSLGDHLSTAFSGPGEMPGIEIHANALDTILNQRFLGALTEPGITVYLILLVSGLWLLFLVWPRSRTLPIFLLFLVASLALPTLIFLLFSYWIPSVSTAVAVVLAASTSQFLHYSQLNRELNRRYGDLSRLLEETRLSERSWGTDQAGQHSVEWKLQLLGDATEAALRHSRERSEVLSFLSHELKTPLTSVQGFAELLSEGRLDAEDDRAEAARFIGVETSRLSRMLDDFLRVSRLEYRASEIKEETVDLKDLLRHACQTLEPQMAAKSMRLEGKEALAETLVSGDRDLLLQVLLNLITNAVKFSPSGTGVRIALHANSEEAMVEVTDQGRGIPEAELPRIFDKFYRGSADSGEGPPGSGLGLAFVKEVIRRHGGRIEVTSQTGLGSTFRVFLPQELPSVNRIESAKYHELENPGH